MDSRRERERRKRERERERRVICPNPYQVGGKRQEHGPRVKWTTGQGEPVYREYSVVKSYESWLKRYRD